MREKRAVAGLIIAVILLALILGGCGGSRHLTAPTAAAKRKCLCRTKVERQCAGACELRRISVSVPHRREPIAAAVS